uniref:Uncharacterized protein n=1 Tax=Leptobrachium leishanense TaxID=445787 RepID=A0A8C5QZ06_9ANUR
MDVETKGKYGKQLINVDLRDELTCSICLNMYMDPVTLTCGHSFCRTCIVDVLDTQNGSGAYKCPECRAESQERPTLVKTTKLRNIADSFRSTYPEQEEEVRIPCTYCDSLVPAAKTCLHCEASLCDKHLRRAKEKVQNLEELRRQVPEKAAGVTERVTALIRDIRKQLEALEKRVLSEISRQEEQISLRVSDLIRQLEIKELSRKMGDIEELCDMTGPFNCPTRTGIRADYYDAEEDTETHDIEGHDVRALDVGLISVTLHSGLTGIVTRISIRRRVPEASDMLLDVNTASDLYFCIKKDLKTVSWSEIDQSRPETPERFQYYAHVLNSSSFSSGRHYWEVEGNESGWWGVGVVYPSMKRKGKRSGIGDNNKSWCLWRRYDNNYSVRHNNKSIQFPHPLSCCRIGIFLDYEAGRLSFYENRRVEEFTHFPNPFPNYHNALFINPLCVCLCIWVFTECHLCVFE